MRWVSIKCFLISIYVIFLGGCGTTKWSDTSRTGTEQLLISNAIDRAIDKVDFSPMQNKKCFLDVSALKEITDRDYLSMTIRQFLTSEGAILSGSLEEADYIVEVRAGAVGTDRDDLMVGIPATTLPAIPGSSYSATSIPEIPFMKRTKQRGVAKIALFAYNKTTGKPVWASGNSIAESTAKNLWFAGAGPLTSGTIYTETTFAGNPIPIPMQSEYDPALEKALVFPEHHSSVAIPIPQAPFSTTENGTLSP